MPLVGALGPEIFHPMTARESVVAEAREWLRTPVHREACLKGVGVDCWGLMAGSARPFGLIDGWFTEACRAFSGYGAMQVPEKLIHGCETFLSPIAITSATLADMFVFQYRRKGVSTKTPAHFGLISRLSPLSIIHAWPPIGRVVEMPIDDKWRKRIHSAWRFRGI